MHGDPRQIDRLLDDLLRSEANLDDRLDPILDQLDDALGPIEVP